jgi:rubrerythrin
MKAKWFIGLSLVIAFLVGFGLFSSATAEAYNGPNGKGSGAQTGQGNGQGMGPSAGMGQGMGPGAGVGQCDGTCTEQGVGQMRGPGGRGNGQGMGPGTGTGQYTAILSADSIKALDEAIQEEYLARATYQAIIAKFGSELPFVNIVRSEGQHVAALARQFTNHGLAVPADSWAGKVTAPATLTEAFTAAIQLEKDDAALYDTLLKQVTEPELTRVFTQLQSASLNMHLKSLEYYNK